jgi:hypothetical protein
MKRENLKVEEVVDGKRVFLGTVENVPIAETLEDVLAMEDLDDGCDASEIVTCFNYGWKVKKRAQFKSASDPKAPTTIFKRLGKSNQEQLLELAREKGLIS